MAYSRAYQTVVAGRVRDEEAIDIFRKNQVVTPARIASLNPVAGKKQVTVTSLALEDTQVGKATGRSSLPTPAFPAPNH